MSAKKRIQKFTFFFLNSEAEPLLSKKNRKLLIPISSGIDICQKKFGEKAFILSNLGKIGYPVIDGFFVSSDILKQIDRGRESPEFPNNFLENGPFCLRSSPNSKELAGPEAFLYLGLNREKADELELTPLARIVSSCLVGSDPALMLTGPIPATEKLLDDTGYSTDDIDIFEINEAFAAVVLAWAKEMKIEIDDRVNPNGGAIAIGHALGSTGPLLITKTVHELHRSNGKLGLISMCCGGGLGTGTIIERL